MTESQPQKWAGLKRFVMGQSLSRTLVRIAILITAVVVTLKWVVLPIRVSGDSMLPTFQDGQVLFGSRLAYRKAGPERGDIVAIDIAGGRQFLLKRIVALPGERFAIRDGTLFINGEPLAEPYVHFPGKKWNRKEILLEPDEYYFIGDNRSMPMENHTTDVVKRERITARIQP